MGAVRAGRLVAMLLELERRGRVTAAELAAELGVSKRTVLRDMEALSGAGVPVYATRGRHGGFHLLEGYRSGVHESMRPTAIVPGSPRVQVRITEQGARTAAVLGLLQPLRLAPPDAPESPDGRRTATARVRSVEETVVHLLALGPEVEVIAPPALREEVARRLGVAAARYEERGPAERA